ncbi:MAG TPA: hypothetical protein VHY75_04010 [Steroidobacteraceae bacterium]|jgi:hypothetical protein|nr:hypothetical protein [Steroidobacteraceae bacterium]
MNHRTRGILHLAMCVALAASIAAAAAAVDDEEEGAAKPADSSGVPALNAQQRRAVGLETTHPIPSRLPERTDALGTVLDRTGLLADASAVAVTAAQEHAVSSELARLQELYRGGAGASLKMLETAQAEDTKARADARLAAARFSQQWAPVAAQAPQVRRALLDSVSSGRAALVRADLPGRHSVGSIPGRAILDVDGMQVPGRVLGALEQPSDLQSAALLIEIRNPPPGLAPGARIPLALFSPDRAGLLLPSAALLYGEDGAYVYKQIPPKAPQDKVRYVAVKVTPLVPYAGGWLVKGVDDDDDIVVYGAGVLWSLEGMGAHPVDDDED